MALLFRIALLSAINAFVNSASNKSHCDIRYITPDGKWCTQNSKSCLPPPCTLLCGMSTQYNTCGQFCTQPSISCDILECRASQSCEQSCLRGNCGSMVCDANDCRQVCTSGNCSSMTCPSTVNSCVQLSASEMTCEADFCTQHCSQPECQMVCPAGSNNCTQGISIGASAAMECDRGVCEQVCFKGRCNISCSSSVTTGRCEQRCLESKCEVMTCHATNCKQVARDGNLTMRCDGKVCEQACLSGDCNMTCSTSVKECHQICYSGKCLFSCDAEKCKVDCFGSSSCTTVEPTSFRKTKNDAGTPIQMDSPVEPTSFLTTKTDASTPLQMGSSMFLGLMPFYIVYM